MTAKSPKGMSSTALIFVTSHLLGASRSGGNRNWLAPIRESGEGVLEFRTQNANPVTSIAT